MSYKTEYSKEEWATLLHAPYYAGMYVQYADVHHLDQRRERHAMVAEATLWEIPDEAKRRLQDLTPAAYLGNAITQARKISQQ